MAILYKRFLSDRFEATYQVHEPQSGMRLDQFIQTFMGPGFSREAIKEKIRLGDITIKNREGEHKPNTKVKEREIINLIIRKTTHEDEYWNGQLLPLESAQILYQDDDLFVIAKPPYMSTHPTGRHLFNCATVFLEEKTGSTVHSIHRLDRETSGILLLARNPRAAGKITPLFEFEKVKKSYFFIGVKNQNFQGKRQFNACERLGSQGQALRDRVYINAYPQDSSEGKRAQTHFQILKEIQGRDKLNYVMGLAFPQTGRQHQIRVHALVHGFPLIGDKLYYGSYPLFQRFKDLKASREDHIYMQLPRHALHAIAINLPYPNVKDPQRCQTFTCPIPSDLKNWMQERLGYQPEALSELENSLKREIKNYFKTLVK